MGGRPKTIRIITAEADRISCRLLSEALGKEPGIAVVASVADYTSFKGSIQTTKADIAVISSTLPGGPLKARSASLAGSNSLPACPWIALVDVSEPQIVVAALRAGATGIFCRNQSDIKLLAKCIRRVMEGQVWVDSQQMHYLLDALVGNGNGNSKDTRTTPKLTRREESVVRLVMQGMGNREIAEHLRLSEHTIKNYLFRIFDKLGVSNRVELALYAVARLHRDEGVAA